MQNEILTRLNSIQGYLGANILGQSEPLQEMVGLLQRSLLGFRYPHRPVCSMLLAGPTGVGKTESVNLFTQYLFGGDKHVRFDMSEYMTLDSIAVLRGRNQGDSGAMGYHIKRTQGKGVMLFDEIEKAHPLILDIFLQILSAGRFSSSSGEVFNLTNYIVVATTNLGSRVLMESKSTDRETIVGRAIRAVTYDMRPEIFARFDLVSVFNKLDNSTLEKIAYLCTCKCHEIMMKQGHQLYVEDPVLDFIKREGYSEHFGARPMEQAAMRIIGGVVSGQMLSNGGKPVSGYIHYERKMNACYFEPNHEPVSPVPV